MNIKTFVFNPFYENTYIISDSEGRAIIVDPGCYENYEKEVLSGYIDDLKLELQGIYNTHCHIDHVLGNSFLKEKYNLDLYIPPGESQMLTAVEAYANQWGIDHYVPCKEDHHISSETLSFGNLSFQVLNAPGHSPGHQIFYSSEHRILIGGDVIFKESIGRTDLPGGDHQQLLSSIRTQIFTLPEETTIYPGHGPVTTVGHEIAHNPFLKIPNH